MAGDRSSYKYDEQQHVQDLMAYIDGTYSQHYVGKRDIQTIDVWDSLGIAGEMCQGTAIKYLMRLGRKDGLNKKDLLKAAHYIVLLMHFIEQQEQNNK